MGHHLGHECSQKSNKQQQRFDDIIRLLQAPIIKVNLQTLILIDVQQL